MTANFIVTLINFDTHYGAETLEEAKKLVVQKGFEASIMNPVSLEVLWAWSPISGWRDLNYSLNSRD